VRSPGSRHAAPFGLHERSADRQWLADRFAAAARGEGSSVLVQGGPGLGKSSLLRVAMADAAGAGVRILAVRAGELEQEHALGVVRQLLHRGLSGLDVARRAVLSGPAEFVARVLADAGPPGQDAAPLEPVVLSNAVYWFVANLAALDPLAILVDDAHWADEASRRVLAYLTIRLAELPVLLVLSGRPERAPAGPALSTMAAESLELRPLSVDGVAAVLADRGIEERLAATVYGATGGNPMLVHDLADELGATGAVGPNAPVEALPSRRIGQRVTARLATHEPAIGALAFACAVLGDGAELQLAADLAGLDHVTLSRAADRLVELDVLAATDPVEFVHPVVRAAVEAAAAPSRRSDAHAAAARLLDAANAGPDAVAAHLQHAMPAADPWAVDRLRVAAADALARGAPDVAARRLGRALREPPGDGERLAVLLALGEAQAGAGDLAALDTLREVQDSDGPLALRARAQNAARRMLSWRGRIEEAVADRGRLADELATQDPEAALLMEAGIVSVARLARGTVALADERMDRRPPSARPRSLGEVAMSANHAVRAVRRGDPVAIGAGLAERALAAPGLIAADAEAAQYFTCVRLLGLCDRVGPANHYADDGLARAQRSGSVLAFAAASMFRCDLRRRQGLLLEAEADARQALEVAVEHELIIVTGGAAAWLVETLVERAELDAAQAVLDLVGMSGGPLPQLLTVNQVLLARARLAVARGQWATAAADAIECGERQEAWGELNPAMAPWRGVLVRALCELGETGEARAVAGENLARAQHFGAASTVGAALAVVGSVADGDARREQLGAAVDTLARSPSTLEHARALVALGAAVRPVDPAAARGLLGRGLALAERCGGVAVADSAHAELIAAGGRPRRREVTGLGSLTAAELRVARLAADGASNATIAQGQFVSAKTVELHLTRVYKKLGIRSRTQLVEHLGRASGQ
jgi:DNA-binding CsgD family transcriptional regulator